MACRRQTSPTPSWLGEMPGNHWGILAHQQVKLPVRQAHDEGVYLSPLHNPLSHELPLRLRIFWLPRPFCGGVPARLSILPWAP